MQGNMQKSSEIPRLFSIMVGLNTNLSMAEFLYVSSRIHGDFPGLNTVGINQQIT